MIGLLARWLTRGVLVAAAAFALVYLGDWAVYQLRGAPKGSVTVQRTMEIPLKGNKVEFDPLGKMEEPCARALFGQSGLPACWQVRKHPNETVAM